MWQGVVVGACACALLLSAVGRRSPAKVDARVRPACSVAILLLEHSRVAMSRAVDHATGALGFSHAAWDACESVDGVDVGIDCRPGLGVHRRPLSEIVGDRRFVRVVLPLIEGREAYGCARARVGEAYDGLAPFAGSSSTRGTVCSELIFDCLPERLRARVQVPHGRPVAPNDLARSFGVLSPTSPDVHLEI